MALTRVQGLLPALGWAEHYRHRLFQDIAADWVPGWGGGEVCRGVPQACSGTPENLSPRSRLVPSKDEKRENQAVQGNARGPHLFSRVPCRSRMALVSLWSEELASGNRLCGSDRKHTPHIDAGCMTFRDSSGVIFC